MGVFKNLKIRTKLIILITLMLFGLLAVGVFSMNNYINAVKALEEIYTHNVITIEKLSDARAQTRGNYANILNYIVTEDKNVRDTILNEYKTRIISINADINEFKADSSYETKQISLIKANMNDWIQVADQIMALVSSNKQDEAIDLFTNSGDATFEKLQTSIKELINNNINQADKIYKNQVNTKSIKTIITNIFIAFMLVLCIVFGVIIIQSITGPIKKVVNLIRKTSELDLIYDTSYASLLKNTDEIGIIAQSVEGLRDELRKVIEKVLNISSNVAENSEILAASTEENTKTINQIVNAINEIAQGNSNQADMVSKTNQTVMTMTTNIDEVNSETGTNSENAEKAIEIIKEGQKAVELTVKKMVENKEVTGEVGKSIEDLSMQIEKVGNIISVIKDISSQTNLLALNASIEAARAGESGKGFAVVATEIGSLAKETDAAVDEITKIIMDTVAKNTQASQKMSAANNIVLEQEHAINITKEAFQTIKTSVDNIAEHTLNISNRINEIDASSNEISDQTQDMSAIAQEAAASSEEISASNEEQLASIELIASAANELSRMATELNDEVIKFKLK